jgi:hypothetical protein
VLRLTRVEAIERVADVLWMYREQRRYTTQALAAMVLDELGWPLTDKSAPASPSSVAGESR